MFSLRSLLVVLACALLTHQEAFAQAKNSITLKAADSPAAGEIQGSGEYTLDTGYSVVSIHLVIFYKGNFVKSVACDYDGTKSPKIWKGIAIGITSGQTYQVHAAMVTITGMFFYDTKTSDKMDVTVK
ncbi:MAG: hypothetical protein L0215_08000 [Gemmataceae bacterium]|nr:hypothetical protein [Gemmataceae bacterium]